MLSCTAEYFLKDKDMWGALMCSRDKSDLESVLGADIKHVPQGAMCFSADQTEKGVFFRLSPPKLRIPTWTH